jgi:glycosyltransferase involved in cell wall biosynthesis
MRLRKAIFIAPIVPALSGNGLAMRMGTFVEALSRIALVDVIVVPVAGGGMSTNSFLQELGVRLHAISVTGRNETHFLLLSQISDERMRLEAFQAYGKPSLASFLSPPVLARISQIIEACKPDFVHIGRSYLGPCVAVIPERTVATLDLDEDDRTSFASQACLARNSRRLALAGWLEQEGLACDAVVSRFGPRFQHMFVASRREALLLARRHPQLTFEPLENAVEIPRCAARRDDGATLLFLGSLSYPPNAEGILSFSQEVLPRLRAIGGRACRLLIAGGQPPITVAALERHPRISVLGQVSDVAELYRRSTLALAPLRAGGGTRIKLLEAAAHGVASVSTPIAAEGLSWPAGAGGWIAATSGQFAEACREALACPAERNRRAARMLDWVRRHHVRKIIVARISQSLVSLQK